MHFIKGSHTSVEERKFWIRLAEMMIGVVLVHDIVSFMPLNLFFCCFAMILCSLPRVVLLLCVLYIITTRSMCHFVFMEFVYILHNDGDGRL